MREQPFLHPGDEHDRILEALGSVQRHQRGPTAARIDLLAVTDQRDALEELRKTAAGLLGVEGAGRGEYLGQIFACASKRRRACRGKARSHYARQPLR